MADAITQLQNDIEAQEIAGIRKTLVAAAQAALTQSRVVFSIASNVKHETTCGRHAPTEPMECHYTGQQLLEFELNKLAEHIAAPELSHLEEAQASVPRWDADHHALPQRVAALGLLLAEEMIDPAENPESSTGQVLLALANFESRCPDRDHYRRARKATLLAHAMDALYYVANAEMDDLLTVIRAGSELIAVRWHIDGTVSAANSQWGWGNIDIWESQGPDCDFEFTLSVLLSSGADRHEFTIA